MKGNLNIKLRVWKVDGKKEIKVYDGNAKCFVAQFAKMIYAYLKATSLGNNEVSITDVSNAAQNYPACSSYAGKFFMGLNAGEGIDEYGIVVGSGTTAVDVADYKLGTLYAHGMAASNLYYKGTTFGALTYVNSNTTAQWTLTRYFYNLSGGELDVSEYALYGLSDVSGSSVYFCLSRDVLTTVTLKAGQGLKMEYTLEVSI